MKTWQMCKVDEWIDRKARGNDERMTGSTGSTDWMKKFPSNEILRLMANLNRASMSAITQSCSVNVRDKSRKKCGVLSVD
jgi:hypothetical protein